MNYNIINSGDIPDPPGQGPVQPAVGDTALAGGLDKMTHRGPFQPRTFCDSVILWWYWFFWFFYTSVEKLFQCYTLHLQRIYLKVALLPQSFPSRHFVSEVVIACSLHGLAILLVGWGGLLFCLHSAMTSNNSLLERNWSLNISPYGTFLWKVLKYTTTFIAQYERSGYHIWHIQLHLRGKCYGHKVLKVLQQFPFLSSAARAFGQALWHFFFFNKKKH